jgi:predicted amidophosphoribosyltransferase
MTPAAAGVICSSCHTSVAPGKFCSHCGETMQKATPPNEGHAAFCTECGTALVPDAKFCGQCGSKRSA